MAPFAPSQQDLDKIASRHPYSYQNAPGGRIPPSQAPAKFSTAYGTDINPTSKIRDRNAGAREAEQALKWGMTEPYPRGYTGHVPGIGNTIGSTYGKQTRYTVNRVDHGAEEPRQDVFLSTFDASYSAPSQQIAERKAAAREARPVARTSQQLVSTAHYSYKAPPPSSYDMPAWTEQATSSIGQLDTYGHFKESTIHKAAPAQSMARPGPRPELRAATTQGGAGAGAAATGASSSSVWVTAPTPAAGVASRPDAFLLRR